MPSRHAARALARRLTVAIVLLLVVATVPGLTVRGLYRDNLLVASGWRGNDIVTLVLAVPLLAAALALERRGSPRARLVWLGLLLYTLYSYAFYLFAAAFNPLFLVYAALVALSLLALALGLGSLDVRTLAAVQPSLPRRRWVAGWLALLALALGGVHVGGALGALVTGVPPGIVAATAHPTNVVAALDLSLVVVPSLLAARWLSAGDPWGVVLAVLLTTKGAVYMPALAAATLGAARAGAPADPRQAALWAGIGLGCLLALGALLARGAPREPGVH